MDNVLDFPNRCEANSPETIDQLKEIELMLLKMKYYMDEIEKIIPSRRNFDLKAITLEDYDKFIRNRK